MWNIVYIQFDGAAYTDQAIPETPETDWVRLVDLPNLIVDEWHGRVLDFYTHWCIYWKE